jgi:hypothetical protein
MAAKNRLSTDEREFFTRVNRAVLANPFSDERMEIDRKISGLFPENSREEVIDEAIREVERRMDLLDKNGKGDIRSYDRDDREIIRTACLFVMFHRYLDRLDALIAGQLKAGKTPVKVDFAHEMTAYLRGHGFDQGESLHFLAICFQLRRAFYFIAKNLVGRSACMKKLRESLWNNVFTFDLDLYNQFLWSRMEDFSTLILGETGSGKGAAARAIGMSGFIPFDEKKSCFRESFTRTFLSLNVSQFSENLIESELFGHKKGSFTGAMEDHKGVFDQCSPCGAIFLDEIGEMSAPVQIKLLKVLEERVFSPVGSHDENRFQGRIIAATNRDIETEGESSGFRRDFFYRLCSDIIVVPPLRERIREDRNELGDLVAYSVERIVGKPSERLSAMVLSAISEQPGKNYAWPGNVRELGQCVRRILLKRAYTARNAGIQPTGQLPVLTIHDGKDYLAATDVLKSYCRELYDRHGTLGEVSRITKLDRRTVKKYIYS